LAIAEKNWKKLNPNTVSGMIGIYLIEKKEGKLQYSPDIVLSQTSFLPVKKITL
jgi:phosphatidate phosphatase PAH1